MPSLGGRKTDLSPILRASNPDPLDLVQRHVLSPPVIELRGARARMVRHRRGALQRPAGFEVRGDAGRPERVIAGLGGDPGRSGSTDDHPVRLALHQGIARQPPRSSLYRTEQRPLRLVREPAAVDVGVQVLLKIVVARHLVPLAALLVEPHP